MCYKDIQMEVYNIVDLTAKLKSSSIVQYRNKILVRRWFGGCGYQKDRGSRVSYGKSKSILLSRSFKVIENYIDE